MAPEVIAAIIAVAGVLVSVFVSFVVSFWGKRYNYHHLFAETVSKSRNKWLNDMREFVADMLANKRREIYGNCNDQNCADVCNKYDTSKFQVLMRLNGNESDHRQLKALILSLDNFDDKTKANGNLEKYKVAEQAILELSTRIFKDEWEKVKEEAKGEVYYE